MKFIISGFGSDGKTKAKLADVYRIEEFRFGTVENLTKLVWCFCMLRKVKDYGKIIYNK